MNIIKSLILSCLLFLTFTANLHAVNNALTFDGTDDYVTRSNANGTVPVFDTSSFTMESWIKVAPFTATYGFRSIATWITNGNVDASSDNAQFRILTNGKLQFGMNTSSSWDVLTSTNTVTTNKWLHVAVVKNGSSVKLYINGVEDGSDTINQTLTPDEFHIGAYEQNSAIFAQTYFPGQMDEVRLWSEVRSQEQIRTNMYKELIGNEANLTAYYNFNETSGTIASDSSTNTYTGTLENMAGTEWTEVQEYDSHHFMSFDGSTQFIDVGVKSDLQILDDLTLEGWLKYSSISGVQTIISNGISSETEADNFPYYFAIQADGKLQVFWEDGLGTNTVLISDASIATITSANSWHHYSLVRDSNAKTVKFYIDGLQFGSEKSYSNNPTGGTTSSLTLAGEYSTATINYFNGSMDEIRIWNIARTQTDIKTNMNKELDGNETNLAAYYNFSSKETQLIDTSYNGNVGTLINSPTVINREEQRLDFDE